MLMIRQWQKHRPFVVCSRCPYSTAAPESTSAKPTFYEVLNVSETANLAEIKSAFIKKSKESHPDINPNRPELHDTFVQINEAYNVLSNASSRHNYDLKLQRTARSRSVAGDVPASDPFGSAPAQHKQYAHQYHDSTHFSTYYRQGGQPYNVSKPVMNAEKTRSNRLIVIGACVFMATGAMVHYMLLRYRHKWYKAQLEESNRKANKLHTEARERARVNGLKGQLEQLIHVSQNNGVDKVAAVKSLQDFYGEKKI